jgi:anti-anti-sigma factor
MRGGVLVASPFELVPDSDGTTFHLRGELDMATADALLEGLRPVLRPGVDIRLELSELEFIDSSGLRALISAADGLRPGGSLILHRPADAVARLLILVRADRIPGFRVVDEADASLAP